MVVPLLLADAYHARVDIPAMIAESGSDARRAQVLGEDDRLINVLRQRLEQAGVSRLDPSVGVLVAAVGSSRPQANAATAAVARKLTMMTRWTATTAFATGPRPTLAQACELLRERGATRLVIAPWFLAPGRITDRVQRSHGHSAFRCRRLSAPTGRWPRRCWTASTRPRQPEPPRRYPTFRLLGAPGVQATGTLVART